MQALLCFFAHSIQSNGLFPLAFYKLLLVQVTHKIERLFDIIYICKLIILIFFSILIGIALFNAKLFNELEPIPSSDTSNSPNPFWFESATLCNS